jgi:hypothetical protein
MEERLALTNALRSLRVLNAETSPEPRRQEITDSIFCGGPAGLRQQMDVWF